MKNLSLNFNKKSNNKSQCIYNRIFLFLRKNIITASIRIHQGNGSLMTKLGLKN